MPAPAMCLLQRDRQLMPHQRYGFSLAIPAIPRAICTVTAYFRCSALSAAATKCSSHYPLCS
jgi:hypothetical protein